MEKSIKVILLNGSPRTKGCTYTALSEVARVLTDERIDSEIVQVGAESDVKQIRGKISAADGLIIGSPVYFASPTGALLTFLDKLFWDSEGFALKPAASVVSARRAGTTASLDVINKYFLIAEMPIVSSQYWCMVHGETPDEVRRDLEGMQIMRTLGRNMAWMLRSIEAGRNAGVPAPVQEPGVSTNFIR